MSDTVIWEEVYKTEYVNAPECRKTCRRYCCKNFYGEHFNILDKTGVSLPLLEKEYEHYKKIGGIRNITTPAKKRTFYLKNGNLLVFTYYPVTVEDYVSHMDTAH